ncbi:hypothetical protein J1N35_033590 [Gossypium stocksii]|uniref:Uncharacterized protein n=1 Tax=Gossypium stocksii TaxID=47602 RepID=A0A9D3ZPR3_9ROSI|nr:hypothetical protein J1N35_033590 [Gossypium stocksii]
MTHLGRTTILKVFTTLLANNYMVVPDSIVDRRWELKAIPDASMLLAGLTCNIARWVMVMHNISLENVLMWRMMRRVVVLV